MTSSLLMVPMMPHRTWTSYLVKDTDSAFQTFQVAKRTLREAREKQALFRKSRQFFPMRRHPGNSAGSETAHRSQAPNPKCFKCGGAHATKDCPDKHAPAKTSQTAHLAFQVCGTNEPSTTETLLQADRGDDPGIFCLRKILSEGKAIIDGGATSSVASVSAMEQIMKLNSDKGVLRDVEVENSERPHFRFGNNGRTQCLSTASVQVPLGDTLGKMSIHVHDIEGQPVLMSIAALRSLGAVIDFERDEAVFKNVDPQRVVSLERAPSGHQLFPLTSDILSTGKSRAQPFHSFLDSAAE